MYTLADRNANLKSPAGLAIDTMGVVYVADTGNHLIRKITSTGKHPICVMPCDLNV